MKTNYKNEILAEIQVSYSVNKKNRSKTKITSSKDAEKLLRSVWNNTLELREEFYVLLLNKANDVLGWHCVSQGGISGTVVDAKLIYSVALKCLACGLIMAHNHPSGNLKPSEADIGLTSKLKEAGRLLDIVVLDHLIITSDKYFSFADDGLI